MTNFEIIRTGPENTLNRRDGPGNLSKFVMMNSTAKGHQKQGMGPIAFAIECTRHSDVAAQK